MAFLVFGVFVNEGIKLSKLTIENPSSSLSHMTMGVGGFIAVFHPFFIMVIHFIFIPTTK